MNVTSRIILTIALAFVIYGQGGKLVITFMKDDKNFTLDCLISIVVACMATAALIGIAISGPRQ